MSPPELGVLINRRGSAQLRRTVPIKWDPSALTIGTRGLPCGREGNANSGGACRPVASGPKDKGLGSKGAAS